MWWSDYWPGHWMFFGHRSRRGRAIDILKERYARGGINQAEFEERRRFLEVTTK